MRQKCPTTQGRVVQTLCHPHMGPIVPTTTVAHKDVTGPVRSRSGTIRRLGKTVTKGVREMVSNPFFSKTYS